MSKSNWGELLRERVPIVEYMERCGESLPLERGNCVQGAHSAHASMNEACLTVYPDKGDYYCFHCREGGSVVNYEMHRSGSLYAEACERIADTYGIDLPSGGAPMAEDERAVWQAARERKQAVQKLLNASARYWQSQVCDAQKQYWAERGIGREAMDTFGIGYAGSDATALLQYLWNDYGCRDVSLLLGTGLFYENKQQKLRCLFVNRHMLPAYRNRDGDVMHFIGRDATGEDDRKYLNQFSRADAGVETAVVRHGIWGLHHLRKPCKVLITEGIVDGMCAQLALPDMCVIAGGSIQWSEAKVSLLVEQLASLRGTKVSSDVKCDITVCFDREAGKHTEAAGNRAAEHLCKAVSDGINGYYEEEKAREARMPRLRIARLPLPPEHAKMDICDFLKVESPARLQDWLNRGITPWQFSAWLSDDTRRFVNINDKSSSEKFVPSRVSDELRLSHYHAVLGKDLCRYAGGVYTPCESDMHREIDSMLGEYVREGRVTEVISGVVRQETYTDADMGNPYLVNVKNGLVDASLELERPVLVPHSPYHRSTMQFTAEWEDGAFPEAFTTFLSEVVDESCIQLVFEMIGYCLMRTARLHKAFILEGSGSNGKSTLIQVIETLLGSANYCAKPFQELEEDKFAAAELYGKAANLFAEMPNQRLYTSAKFKTITSGDTLSVQQKYERAFEFRPTATQIVSVNKIPKSLDDTPGFYRRLCIIPFTRRFVEGDATTKNQEQLIAELTTERELRGILFMSVVAVREALRRNAFSNPKPVSDMLSAYKRDNNSAIDFLTSRVDVPHADYNTAKADIYSAYRAHCEEELFEKPLSSKMFHKTFRDVYPDVEQGNRRLDGKMRPCYVNVRLSEGEPDIIDEIGGSDG